MRPRLGHVAVVSLGIWQTLVRWPSPPPPHSSHIVLPGILRFCPPLDPALSSDLFAGVWVVKGRRLATMVGGVMAPLGMDLSSYSGRLHAKRQAVSNTLLFWC